MAIDTTIGESEYPGEEDLGTPRDLPASGRRSAVAATQHLGGPSSGRVVGYLHRALARQPHRQRLHQRCQDSGQNDVAIVLGLSLRRRSAGWPVSGRSTTRWPRSSAGASRPHRSEQSWTRYFRLHRRPQGRRAAVHGRRPPVPLHRRPAGHGHPHRAAEPDQPRLRSGDLHRHRQRARHDHDDDGVVGRRRAARELAGPPHDRRPAAWPSPASRPSRSGSSWPATSSS